MSNTINAHAHPFRVLMYAAYFTPEYSGGAFQALTLARELRQRGHYVEFISNRWHGLAPFSEVDGFPVWRIKPGRAYRYREFRLWANLTRYVWRRRHHFDILQSNSAYFTQAFIGMLGNVSGLRTIVKASLAEDDLKDIHRPLVRNLHHHMLNRLDACVAISQDLGREFLASGVKRHKIKHIPNGVDTQRFQPSAPDQRSALRAKLDLPPDQPILLYVGVLDKRKNIEWLARQWVTQRTFGTNALLLAVGPQSRDDPGGELRGRLAALAQAFPGCFRLCDYSADILPYYQAADVMILPSRKEGLPNVILEAMACGLPCVAARASGSRELIVQGETGYTYTHDNAEGMAVAVRQCLSPTGAMFGVRAREVAQACYSIKVVADGYEALYIKLLHPTKLHGTTQSPG